jgi:hypothetical protein
LSVVRDADFCRVSYVLPALEDVLYADWYTSVLFIRSRCVVGYSIVKGSPSLVYVTGYKDRAVMPVLARKDCRVRLRKTTQPGGVDFYFNPLKTPAADSILVHELNERCVVDSVMGISLSGLFLFTMFDDQGEDVREFQYAIDSLDITGHDLDEVFVRKALAAVMASGEYRLVWSMGEGAFKEPDMLFKSDWEILSTFGMCFPGEDPVVEFDRERRREKLWESLMVRATGVLQR